jgi:hypothetical protein
MKTYEEIQNELFKKQLLLSEDDERVVPLLRGIEGILKAVKFMGDDEDKDPIIENICSMVFAYVTVCNKDKKSSKKLYDDIIDYSKGFDACILGLRLED